MHALIARSLIIIIFWRSADSEVAPTSGLMYYIEILDMHDLQYFGHPCITSLWWSYNVIKILKIATMPCIVDMQYSYMLLMHSTPYGNTYNIATSW
jgi:hypothetical protein